MNKIKFALLIFLFAILNIFSQTSLDVVITGECFESSDIYDFIEIFNGKNQYLASVNFGGGNVVDLKIGFDGTKWVLYANDITDFGFFNTNVTEGLIPPFTGWTVAACNTGTLTISENTASQNDATLNQKIDIYPNPSTKNVTINLSNKKIESITIYNVFGKKIKFFYQTKIIDTSFLEKGVYFLTIKTTNNSYFTSKKIIKI